MFIVQFNRADGKQPELYPYRTREEAQKHFDAFLTDDSGLYKNISIYDDVRQFVVKILRFHNGKPDKVFALNDCVRLNREYTSPGEEHDLYAIVNLNDVTDRADIACLTSKLSIPPRETVGLWMIRPVGTTVDDILSAANE